VLLHRAFREVTRDLLLMRLRLVSHIGMGILIGFLFFKLGSSPSSSTFMNVLGYYFFSLMFLMMAAILPTVLTFPMEKDVFIREHLNNWYSVRAYFCAISIADLPFQVRVFGASTGMMHISVSPVVFNVFRNASLD
jgi:ATP-binding cassette subfamily G (WHITE) protein 1